jgi:hypothetical protein
MTKRHFVAFAKLIANMADRAEAHRFALIVVAVASDDNPRFDRTRFMRACGLEA